MTNWHGQLQLDFAVRDGVTQLVQSQAIAPLKVQRSFPQADGTCQVVMLHTAGGLVGGDRLTTQIQMTPESQVLLTTPAAAKAYKSNGKVAQQQVTVQVGAGGYLEWLPQETIVFEQAQYQQSLRIELGAGAQVMLWDMTRFGRTARGEQFLQGDWRSQTEVWRGEEPLWIDRQWLPGSPERWQSLHGLAGCPVVGTLAWVGQAVEPELVQQVRDLWTGDPQRMGVTRLPLGLLCRYRGDLSHEVRRWFVAVWELIRRSQWQREIELPRVWMM